jgi:SAM-dependent methyltransferase
MRENTARQRAVVEWFDSMYERKGLRYLRPLEAYVIFLELLRAQSHDALLDVGCGPGVLLRAARRYTQRLYGVDVSTVALAQAQADVPEANVLLANAERLPYRAETFDLIVCLGSLERMLDVSKALREMHRVGTPRARYCFLVRNSSTFAWKYLAWMQAKQRAQGHAGADTLVNWTRLFQLHGFRIAKVLPDQYPLQLKKRWASLGLKDVDFKRPMLPHTPIERANEFIFLLEKAP